jgi:hypothetical protein
MFPKTYRLSVKVPSILAVMSPRELDAYVRVHWTEWQEKWRPFGCSPSPDAVLRLSAGQPMYVVQRGTTTYLVADATRVVWDAAA